MKTGARFGALALVVTVVLSSSGCSPQEIDSGLTPEQAKSKAQRVETRIAALVPKEYVQDGTQQATGTVMSCGPHTFSWHGHTYLSLKATSDYERVLRTIIAGVKRFPGYTVQMRKFWDGTPFADIWGPFGSEFVAGPGTEDLQYSVSSSSQCFKFPEGQLPDGF